MWTPGCPSSPPGHSRRSSLPCIGPSLSAAPIACTTKRHFSNFVLTLGTPGRPSSPPGHNTRFTASCCSTACLVQGLPFQQHPYALPGRTKTFISIQPLILSALLGLKSSVYTRRNNNSFILGYVLPCTGPCLVAAPIACPNKHSCQYNGSICAACFEQCHGHQQQQLSRSKA